MTKEQKQFLLNLISQIQIQPANPEAAKIVELVQGIIEYLNRDERCTG